jgi:hypothetical protein
VLAASGWRARAYEQRRFEYTVIPIGIGLAGHQAPGDVLRASYYRTTSTVGRIPPVVYPMPAHIH